MCGKYSRIYGIAAFSATGGFLFGYHTGVISGVLIMKDFINMTFNYDPESIRKYGGNLTDLITGLIVGILLFGCFVGSLIGGQISDRFSRKYSIAVSSFIFTISAALQTASYSLAMLLVGRFFAGLSIGALSTIVPVYHSEIAETKFRGRITTLQQWAITTGIATSFWVNYATHKGGSLKDHRSEWMVPIGLQMIPSLILTIGILFCPFSPRWLISQDREDEAKDVLMKIRSTSPDEIEEEMDRIKNEMAYLRENEIESYRQLFRVPLLRPFLLGIGIQILQQLTGINAVIYYAPGFFSQILNKTTKNTDAVADAALVATGALGCVGFILTVPTMIFIDKLGRRKLLISGAIIMSVSMLIAAVLFLIYGHIIPATSTKPASYYIDKIPAAVIIVVFIHIFIGGFSYSWGPIPWIYCAEIFPLTIRAKATSITTAANWAANCLISFLVPRLYSRTQYGVFLMSSIFCALMVGIVYLFYPETKDKHLEHSDIFNSKHIFVPKWLRNRRNDYEHLDDHPVDQEETILPYDAQNSTISQTDLLPNRNIDSNQVFT